MTAASIFRLKTVRYSVLDIQMCPMYSNLCFSIAFRNNVYKDNVDFVFIVSFAILIEAFVWSVMAIVWFSL